MTYQLIFNLCTIAAILALVYQLTTLETRTGFISVRACRAERRAEKLEEKLQALATVQGFSIETKPAHTIPEVIEIHRIKK